MCECTFGCLVKENKFHVSVTCIFHSTNIYPLTNVAPFTKFNNNASCKNLKLHDMNGYTALHACVGDADSRTSQITGLCLSSNGIILIQIVLKIRQLLQTLNHATDRHTQTTWCYRTFVCFTNESTPK